MGSLVGLGLGLGLDASESFMAHCLQERIHSVVRFS